MSTEIVKQDYSKEQLDLLKTTIAKGTTDEQFRLFVQVCQLTGLNPFARQIYAVVRNTKKKIDGRDAWVPEMSIQTSIDGYRLLAQRSSEYCGQDGPYYLDGKTKQWLDYWIEDYPPVAARVGVMRKGFTQFLYAVARFESYAVREAPQYGGNLKNLWAKMPEVMIAKVAEALALRRAFPAELSGIYTKEEMDQADMPEVAPAPPARPPSPEPQPENVVDAAPVSVESIPTVRQIRDLFERVQPTTDRGTALTFEQFYKLLVRKMYESDDAISPDACLRMKQYLDGVQQKKAS